MPRPEGGFEELLVLWRKDGEGRIPRAHIVVAPMDFGVHWAASPLGLGLGPDELLGEAPGLVAFVPASGLGYAQTLLKRRFGVEPGVTRLVGVLEGGVALRHAVPGLSASVRGLSLIAGEIPSDNELRSGKAGAFEILGAWGLPMPSRLKVIPPMKERLGEAWPEGALPRGCRRNIARCGTGLVRALAARADPAAGGLLASGVSPQRQGPSSAQPDVAPLFLSAQHVRERELHRLRRPFVLRDLVGAELAEAIDHALDGDFRRRGTGGDADVLDSLEPLSRGSRPLRG